MVYRSAIPSRVKVAALCATPAVCVLYRRGGRAESIGVSRGLVCLIRVLQLSSKERQITQPHLGARASFFSKLHVNLREFVADGTQRLRNRIASKIHLYKGSDNHCAKRVYVKLARCAVELWYEKLSLRELCQVAV